MHGTFAAITKRLASFAPPRGLLGQQELLISGLWEMPFMASTKFSPRVKRNKTAWEGKGIPTPVESRSYKVRDEGMFARNQIVPGNKRTLVAQTPNLHPTLLVLGKPAFPCNALVHDVFRLFSLVFWDDAYETKKKL